MYIYIYVCVCEARSQSHVSSIKFGVVVLGRPILCGIFMDFLSVRHSVTCIYTIDGHHKITFTETSSIKPRKPKTLTKNISLQTKQRPKD